MGRDPGEIYRELTREFGEPVYDRVEAPATPEQKAILENLSPQQVQIKNLAGEKIMTILTEAKKTLPIAMASMMNAYTIEYGALMTLPYVLLTIVVVLQALPLATLLAWLSLPLALRATRRVFGQTGRSLNVALAETGQTALLYSVLFAVGIVLAH